MHKCLRVQEIARVAISYIARECDKLHFAQTCTTLCDVALDALWADTPDVLLKLLACLPWETVQTLGDLNDTGAMRKLTPHDWVRFLHYAKRVSVVAITDSTGQFYLDVLKDFFQDRPVLPNLKSLHLDSTHADYIRLFLSPRLQHFSMAAQSDQELTAAVKQLEDACGARVHSLRFRRWDHASESFSPSAWQNAKIHVKQILAFPALASLDTHMPLEPEDVLELAALPRLVELTRDVQPFSRRIGRRIVQDLAPGEKRDLPVKETRLRPTTFPALARFTFAGQVEDALSLLRVVSLPVIEALHLNLQWAASNSRFTYKNAVGNIVTSLARFQTLRELRLVLQLNTSAVLPASILAPLLPLGSLSVVYISGVALTARPEDISVMAHAWPRLKTLYLGLGHPESGLSICIEDLLPLAEHCPLLNDVTVAVTGSNKLGRAPLAMPGPVVNRELKWLCLLGWSVHGTVACSRVVAFMRTVFPNAVLQADGPVLDMMREERAKAASSED